MDYYVAIREKCMNFYREKTPGTIWDWAMECMDLEGLPMHCPPHHFLVPAVLLTACAAKEGRTEENLSGMLMEAEKRAKKVLGGFCLWELWCRSGDWYFSQRLYGHNTAVGRMLAVGKRSYRKKPDSDCLGGRPAMLQTKQFFGF